MIKKMFNKRYVIGIDPGTGSESALGICLYDSEFKQILFTESIWPTTGKAPRDMSTRERIYRISDKVKDIVESIVESYGVENVGLSIEAFLIRGKGGETLMRLKGAVLSKVPLKLEVVEIQNTTVKKRAGGTGAANKKEIAEHLQTILPSTNKEHMKELARSCKWDEVDAVAIAYSAVEFVYEI